MGPTTRNSMLLFLADYYTLYQLYYTLKCSFFADHYTLYQLYYTHYQLYLHTLLLLFADHYIPAPIPGEQR